MNTRCLIIVLPLLAAPVAAVAHPWYVRERGTRVCYNTLSLPSAHDRAIMRTPATFADYMLKAYGNHTHVHLSRAVTPKPNILVTVVSGNRRVHLPQEYDFVDFFSSKKICQEIASQDSSNIVDPPH